MSSDRCHDGAKSRRGVPVGDGDVRGPAVRGGLLAVERGAVLHTGRQVPPGHVHRSGGTVPQASDRDPGERAVAEPLSVPDQPRMTIAIGATVMCPGDGMVGHEVEMIASRHPHPEEMEAYERLLTDAMAGDQTLLPARTTSRRRGESSILSSTRR